MFLSHSSSLHSTTVGVFLINICLALTALYTFTIVSFYTTSSEWLCIVFSSLFHWFFLVSTLALTTPAVFKVWEPNPGRKRWLFFILTTLLSWGEFMLYCYLIVYRHCHSYNYYLYLSAVVPAIIVVISVAPDYENYTDDQL